jgi:serine/threonine protein kinase
MTKTGMMVGSMGFMAPEQISGHPGPAADIFAWGVTVAYAASGRSPFGAGNTHSVLYRIMYGEADIAAVPDPVRPLVEAALAKDPQGRPTAQQLLDRLTSAARRTERINDAPTQVISPQIWQTGLYSRSPADRPDEANRARPRGPSPPAAERTTTESPVPVAPASVAPAPEVPGTGKIPVSRRVATIAASALVAVRRHRPGRRAAGRARSK